MKKLMLVNREIPYRITKKDNKNTYFYFKRDGFIQINMSKYQTESQIIKYIMKNEEYFLKKFNKNCITKLINPHIFKLWGTEYNIINVDTNEISLSDNEIYVPINVVDHNDIALVKYAKSEMLSYLNELVLKHASNSYVNLNNLTLKTRFTTTRHGSCNPKKRAININLNLIRYDKKYTEYVFLHEIAHLKEANHGKGFYDLLGLICPDYKAIKKELRLQR